MFPACTPYRFFSISLLSHSSPACLPKLIMTLQAVTPSALHHAQIFTFLVHSTLDSRHKSYLSARSSRSVLFPVPQVPFREVENVFHLQFLQQGILETQRLRSLWMSLGFHTSWSLFASNLSSINPDYDPVATHSHNLPIYRFRRRDRRWRGPARISFSANGSR